MGQDDGYYIGNEPAVPRLNIPSLNMQDAAQGFRTTDIRQIGQVTAWPCSLAVAGTWDAELAETWGAALGDEHRGKGANVILGPSVNVHRVAVGGRNAEYISGEEPKLGEVMAASYVTGVQSRGVLAVAKHFALNNQETNRNTVDSHASERSMHEVRAREASTEKMPGCGRNGRVKRIQKKLLVCGHMFISNRPRPRC
jgi:beta-glucosidase